MARENAAFVFEGMAERNVRDVVKQRGNPNDVFIVRGDGGNTLARRTDSELWPSGGAERGSRVWTADGKTR
jgi:hypothetical protein